MNQLKFLKHGILSLLLIVLMYQSCEMPPSVILEPVPIVTEEMKRQQEWDDEYNRMVDTIKWHEGYRGYPYYCMANVLTVGYGHAIKKGERFEYPLSKQQAEDLLRADFDASIDYIRRTTDLEHMQLLAMAHFVYALGSGNFSQSTLKRLIHMDLPIDNEIVKWIHIKTNRGYVKSDHLLRSRKMELNLYNSQT